jgi:hypothetical protein
MNGDNSSIRLLMSMSVRASDKTYSLAMPAIVSFAWVAMGNDFAL